MKVTKFLAMLLCGLTMCFGFASCDDDEDDAGDGPGSGSFNVEGFTSGKLSYAYYTISGSKCQILLTNYDPYSLKSESQIKAGYAGMGITFDCSTNEIPTGTFDCYLEGDRFASKDKKYNFESNSGSKITIKKSGSTYNISVTGKADRCKIENSNGSNIERIEGSKKLTVSYKGKIEKLK